MARGKNITLNVASYQFCQWWPQPARKLLLAQATRIFGDALGRWFLSQSVLASRLWTALIRVGLRWSMIRVVNFHDGKGMARRNMTHIIENVANGTLHPDKVTSGIYEWDSIPEVLTSADAGHQPIATLPI